MDAADRLEEPSTGVTRRSSLPSILAKGPAFTRAAEARAADLYPFFRSLSAVHPNEAEMNGNPILMLGSNSYLGLTQHPEVKQAVRDAIERYGTGCAGSRFLNGALDLHEELEAALGEFLGREAVLLYSTGYQANLGVIEALVGRGEFVLTDKANHASIVDGCRLSHGTTIRFRHGDVEGLEARLSELDPSKGKLVVVDGVFSMEGDLAKLPEVCAVAERFDAAVMVDDAHALGVLGAGGRGTPDHFGVTDQVHLLIGTFSKSLASQGGFVAADAATIEYLKHHSRTLMFSASLSPSCTAAALAALKVLRKEPERIEQLWTNTERLRKGLDEVGFDTGTSASPIIPIYCRDFLTTLRFLKGLERRGIFVNSVLPPAVQPGDELVRISLMATHTADQIDFALEQLTAVGKELGLLESS
jgi:8-amino-7-oxononanoate synthase